MSLAFITILEKSRKLGLIPFLQSLTDADKKQLVPLIKALSKEYLEFKEVRTVLNSFSYKQNANDTQRSILLISSFVCFNRKDFEKSSFPSWILDEQHLRKVIDWYCPDWFSDFVNKLGEQEFLFYTVSYKLVMELTERGFLQPSRQILVKLLPQIIFVNTDKKWHYEPEHILKYPVTLKEHIWYLFEEESNIHNSDRWLNFGEDVQKEKQGWIVLFKQYSAEGKIDRSRLLQEALLASNKNFNKTLSGWFSDLFIELQPTQAEVLNLQKELFAVLNAPHSKPVNTALHFIKKVITEKQFDGVSFLDQVPVLLTSDTKNTVASTLMILEKLAKKNKSLQLPICKAVVAVFIHTNDDLQLRAAKIIDTYRDQLDDDFSEALQPYQDSMMSSARKLLNNFYVAASENSEVEEPSDAIKLLASAQADLPEITLPESIDDLIFLASQAFDNNQSWHIDILPAAIIKWQQDLQGENIDKLAPALQRALQMTKSDFRAGIGSLDHMLSIFFIDVCIWLARKYSNDANALLSIFTKFDQKEGNTKQRWMAKQEGTFYMEGWDNHSHDPFYLPYKQLLLAALQKITIRESINFLSTPTHQPGWIDPATLVRRVLLYQQANIVPYDIDFQVAVSRCLLTDTGKAAILAEEQISGENKNLLLFLFGHHSTPTGPFYNKAIWMCCSVALKEKKTYLEFEGFQYYKKPFETYTGQFPWQSIEEEYDLQTYDYQLKKTVTKKASRKVLNVQVNKTASKESSGLKKFFANIFQKSSKEQVIIYDYFTIKAQWLSIENDIQRILLLAPNNPEAFLAEITQHCLKDPTFSSESDKKMVIATLQILYEIWGDYGEMAYLFLGTCMIASDKTVVNIAGEIWIKGVSSGKMNNEQLGKIIGLHETIEFAPLKRLTDLFSQSLYNVSAVHNTHLQHLIENILLQLPAIPIKNLKKLLEMFSELLSKNNTAVRNPILQDKLNSWAENNGLQKLIKNITG